MVLEGTFKCPPGFIPGFTAAFRGDLLLLSCQVSRDPLLSCCGCTATHSSIMKMFNIKSARYYDLGCAFCEYEQ